MTKETKNPLDGQPTLVLNAIRRSYADTGIIPSVQELVDALKFRSKNAVNNSLRKLEQHGLLNPCDGKSRISKPLGFYPEMTDSGLVCESTRIIRTFIGPKNTVAVLIIAKGGEKTVKSVPVPAIVATAKKQGVTLGFAPMQRAAEMVAKLIPAE